VQGPPGLARSVASPQTRLSKRVLVCSNQGSLDIPKAIFYDMMPCLIRFQREARSGLKDHSHRR